MDDEYSDYNPDVDDTDTYDYGDDTNNDHNIKPVIARVCPNNPINNHLPPHQQEEEKEDIGQNI